MYAVIILTCQTWQVVLLLKPVTSSIIYNQKYIAFILASQSGQTTKEEIAVATTLAQCTL